jgi:phosphoglycolate phosphatase-like HAD superfamily hydrolase
MKQSAAPAQSTLNRRVFFPVVGAFLASLAVPSPNSAMSATADDPLPSWNDGATKKAIIEFVQATTDSTKPTFVPTEQRIATFDQDGTLWVEHPVYSQVMYILDRVPAIVKDNPKLRDAEPFKTVLSGNREAIARLPMHDLEVLAAAALSGMTTEQFQQEAEAWIAKARDPRWERPYTDLTYQPMQEVLSYLRANGFKTYIVTGGGQDFVRVYSEKIYGIPPEQVIGTAGEIKFSYGKDGKPILTKEPNFCSMITLPASLKAYIW